MPETIQLSDNSYFSIEEGSAAGKKKIAFFYDDPERKHGDNIMLVLYPPGNPKVQVPMVYDEARKRYSAEIERANDAGEKFEIITATELLQKGFICLKNGEQQPVNKKPGIPEGTLETLLLTNDGKIKKPDTLDETKLAEGERFVEVYLPPGYDAKKQPPYNFQVTLDGGQYLHLMQMNVIFDNLIAAGQMEPVVTVFISPHSGPPAPVNKVAGFGVVMPPGYPLSMRLKEYSCNYKFADMLANMTKSLRDQVNITKEREHTTIWGVSAGGLQSIYTALLHPDVFGNVVAQSPQAWNIPEQLGLGVEGDHWRKGIVEKFDERGNCTWESATAKLPDIEGPHNEHITQIMRSSQDPISGRTLESSNPIKFFFDAGELEKLYEPKKGSANLVAATQEFAKATMQSGHRVIDSTVHVLPNGGHHTMTWMRSFADAARSIHPLTHRLSAEAMPPRLSMTTHPHQLQFSTPAVPPAPSASAHQTTMDSAPSPTPVAPVNKDKM